MKIWQDSNALEPCGAVHGNGSTLQLEIWQGSNMWKKVWRDQKIILQLCRKLIFYNFWGITGRSWGSTRQSLF